MYCPSHCKEQATCQVPFFKAIWLLGLELERVLFLVVEQLNAIDRRIKHLMSSCCNSMNLPGKFSSISHHTLHQKLQFVKNEHLTDSLTN